MAEFNPAQPFEVVGSTPVSDTEPLPRAEFDPNKPFQVIDQKPKVEFNSAAPAEPVDSRPMPGVIDALTQGIGSGITGVGQTAGLAGKALRTAVTGRKNPAEKPEVSEQSPAAAPFEWRDFTSPSRAVAKTAYQLGHSAPGIAGGIAGTIGGAAAGAPVAGVGAAPGALIGGATGMMLGTALQTVGPVFAEELRKNPDDPDKAWDNALKSSAVTSLVSGAGWLAFPLKVFNGPIKNMVFQAVGIQPSISTVGQAVKNVVEDRPVIENLGQAYTQGIAGSVVPMAGHGAASLAGKGVKKTFSDAITANDLFREIQMATTPMAAEGALRSTRASAKDFANEIRGAQYTQHEQVDLVKKIATTEERREAYLAGDTESVALQQGMTPAQVEASGIGLSTLNPRLRKATDLLQGDNRGAYDDAVRVGVFSGPGLPSYGPRVVMMMEADGSFSRPRDRGPPTLKPEVSGISTTTPQMKERRHLTIEETEAAAKAKFGAGAEVVKDIAMLPIVTGRLRMATAGRKLINNVEEIGKSVGMQLVSHGSKPGNDWFTINHPAFTTFKVRIDPKTNKAVLKEDGNPVFDRVPIYVHNAFAGPLKAVLHSGDSGKIYGHLMHLKAKATTAIMYSPLIHNMVEFGRAIPASPGKVATGWIYFQGNAARHGYEFSNPATYMWQTAAGTRKPLPGGFDAMNTAIVEHGLVPIGRRFGIQDITGMMEDPNIAPGRGWIAQGAGAVTESVAGKRAGDAARRGVDKAGDFWHGTLLWDRIADLQFGLYNDFKNKLVRKGMDETTAGRTAAHLANRYAGALPMESMSENARKLANLTMFSRSFTLGNIGAMKDAINGLPRDVQAQIMRDAGPLMHAKATKYATRKARQILMMDMALAYAMNSALQSGVRYAMGTTGSQIGEEYLERVHKLLQKTKEHPLEVLRHPFESIESMTEMAHNEPDRKDRVLVGHQDDGTAIYGRNPVGKIGEEFIGWITSPLKQAKKKLSTVVRPLSDTYSNDKGFGRKVFNPHDPWYKQTAKVVQHFMEAQLPVESIGGAWDLATGEGTKDERRLNMLKTLGPLAGVTFSKGAPGGPAVGEMYRAKEKFDIPVQEAMPELRKLIKRGHMSEALAKMRELKMDRNYQTYVIRTTLNPSRRITKRGRDILYRTGDQEAIENFERSLRRGTGLTPP